MFFLMIVSFELVIQKIAIMKCSEESYLGFRTKLIMDNVCAACVYKACLSNKNFSVIFLCVVALLDLVKKSFLVP